MPHHARRRPSLVRSARSALAIVLLSLLGAGCAVLRPSPAGPAEPPCTPPARSMLQPADGAWFGVSPDWQHDSVADFAERLGHSPAVVVTFAGVPMSSAERTNVDLAVQQAKAAGSMLLLTLEPRRGLSGVTTNVAADLGTQMDGYNHDGVPVIVRFGHEMNGSWYAWGQDPAAYVRTFRRVATALHQRAPGSAMMWAPNYGGGYPFAGGRYGAKRGSAAAAALDTDNSGTLTTADDPYAPYWPGRDAVDWVGMSLYHWGTRHPWGENEVPEAGKFEDLLRGSYDGRGGDETAVPDFYRRYGRDQRLPVAVTETAAFYRPGVRGADEVAIKQAWWRQVFAADHSDSLPYLKMINWFEWNKSEPEIGDNVDWTVTSAPRTLEPFVRALPGWVHFAEDLSHPCR